MSATELQNLVRLLANNCYVRYWLNWGDVPLFSNEPRTMAISLLQIDDKGQAEPRFYEDLIQKGFRLEYIGGWPYYFIQRTDWPVREQGWTPKTDFQVGDDVIVDSSDGEYEATVLEISENSKGFDILTLRPKHWTADHYVKSVSTNHNRCRKT